MADVAALRKRLGLSQSDFSACFKLPLRSVQAWEQLFRSPRGASLVLLEMIDFDAEAVIAILEKIENKKREAEGSIDVPNGEST